LLGLLRLYGLDFIVMHMYWYDLNLECMWRQFDHEPWTLLCLKRRGLRPQIPVFICRSLEFPEYVFSEVGKATVQCSIILVWASFFLKHYQKTFHNSKSCSSRHKQAKIHAHFIMIPLFQCKFLASPSPFFPLPSHDAGHQ